MTMTRQAALLKHSLGFFLRRHHRDNEPWLTAEAVMAATEAEVSGGLFQPCGKYTGMQALMRRDGVVPGDLVLIDRALECLGGATDENYARLAFALHAMEVNLDEATPEFLHGLSLHVFSGSKRLRVQREAAEGLLRLHDPTAHALWQAETGAVLLFDHTAFLRSQLWRVRELRIGDRLFVVAAANHGGRHGQNP